MPLAVRSCCEAVKCWTRFYITLLAAIIANGGNWRSKSLALPLMFSSTLDGFYFANCVLSAALLSELLTI